jgi:predicted dehydrogenase
MSALAIAALPVGLIGLGKHGVRYLTHLRADVPELRLVAVCRQDEEQGRAVASELGAAYHRDPVELVSDPQVRAVIAVVPPIEHARIVAAVADHAKPLLLEKPFAFDLASGIRQRDLLAARSVPCLVAHTLRYSPVVRVLRERVAELGRLSQMVLGQSFEPTRLGWLDDPERSGGGNILHTGVHMFDLLRHLSDGEVVRASCATACVTTRRTEDSFTASMAIAVGGGPDVLAAVAGARTTRSRYGEIRLIGERGQLVGDHVHGRVTHIVDRREELVATLADEPTVLAVLRDFARVASGASASPITPDDGLAAVAIADACYRSAASGRVVAVWPREESE